jgi:hypothetical protein
VWVLSTSTLHLVVLKRLAFVQWIRIGLWLAAAQAVYVA